MKYKIFEEKLLDYLSDDPNFCALYGIEKNLGQLPDPGKNKLIQKQGKLRLLFNLLKKVQTKNSDEELDLKLCELLIERENVKYETHIDGVLEIFKKPIASSMIIDPIFNFLLNDQREEKLRLVNIISRLKAIPSFLISMKRNINKPLKRWRDIEVDNMQSLEDLFISIREFALSFNFKNQTLLDDVLSKAKKSIDDYINFLKISETSDELHIGMEQAQRIIKSNGIDLNIQEIHKLAKDFIFQNQKETKKYLDKLNHKYHQSLNEVEMQSFLNEKFKVKNVLEAYEEEKHKIRDFIVENKILPFIDNEQMKIMKTPEFMINLIPAGAMCPPLPFKEGIKQSLVFLTLNDSNGADHNSLSIPPMMVHEGIPGHHLQFCYAKENKSKVRSFFGANDLSEGWATYMEEYIFEKGYKSEFKDEIFFIIKRDMARLGARVAIDLYFMIGDEKYLDIGVDFDQSSSDSFEKAKKLLIAVTGFSQVRADGELNWYSMERGYPMTYLVGNTLLKKIKKSSGLVDFDFHKAFLKKGNMPLSMLNL